MPRECGLLGNGETIGEIVGHSSNKHSQAPEFACGCICSCALESALEFYPGQSFTLSPRSNEVIHLRETIMRISFMIEVMHWTKRFDFN